MKAMRFVVAVLALAISAACSATDITSPALPDAAPSQGQFGSGD